MPPLKPHSKLVLLASLYAAQGLPFGFFTQAVPVQMRAQGASLATVGLASALATPWGLKFLWAPWIDRFGSERLGHRRGWILAMQACTIATLLAIALLGEETVSTPVLVLVLCVNLFAATQDIATDALAVSLLSESERGIGNGVQVAAYRVGMIIGGGALLALMASLGFRGVMLVLAGCLALSTLPVLGYREPARAIHVQVSPAATFARFRDARMQRFVIVLATYKVGEALANAMLRPYLVDQGHDLTVIGTLLGTVGFGCGLVGSLLGGISVTRLGRTRALVLFGFGQSAAVGSYAWLATTTPSLTLLGLAIGIEHVFAGMATAALFTAMMDQCRPGHEGTDYTLMASVVVLASGGAALVSGVLAQAVGYTTHFAVASLLSALSLTPFVLSARRNESLLTGGSP